MRIESFASRVAIVPIFSCLITAGLTSAGLAQNRTKPGQPDASPEELSLAKAIMSAPDAAAKLKAAAELLKKHPKTALRPTGATAVPPGHRVLLQVSAQQLDRRLAEANRQIQGGGQVARVNGAVAAVEIV